MTPNVTTDIGGGQPPPVPLPLTGRVELAARDAAAGGADAGADSHYDRCAFAFASAGDVIGRVVPASGLTDEAPRIELGDGVALGDDGVSLVATRAGCVRSAGNRVAVDPALRVRGTVDFSSGNVHYPAGDVRVDGNVADLFEVRAGGTVEVGGAIEAARVTAGGDVRVKGGILGRDKGLVTAAGGVCCHFAENATVVAGGDVVADAELTHSRVTSGGRIVVGPTVGRGRGAIIAGRVVGARGVTARVLGTAANVVTEVEAGSDPELLRLWAAAADRVRDLRGRAQRIREQLEPLMKCLKRLTAAQREQVTELLYQADEHETAAAALLAPVAERFRSVQPHLKAEVVVAEAVWPGTVVRMPDVEATVPKMLRGPLKLIRRDAAGGTAEVVVVVAGGAKPFALPGRPVPDPIHALRAALGVTARAAA